MNRLADGLGAPVALPVEIVTGFESDGFARLASLLAPRDLAPFLALIDEATRSALPIPVALLARSTGGHGLVPPGNLWQRVERVRPLTFSERLASAAAQLLGVEAVRVYRDEALVTEPAGAPVPWHRDQTSWPIDGDRIVTAWVPLATVALSQGPVRYAVGSHRADGHRWATAVDGSGPGLAEPTSCCPRRVDEQPVRLGDVAFHLGRTVHGAGPNLSRTPHVAFSVIYVADGSLVAQPRTDGQRLERELWLGDTPVGEPVASWLHPLAWSSDGRHLSTLDELPAPERRLGTLRLTPDHPCDEETCT